MFGQNKRKIDSKIRFQNPRFRKQLQSARGYKRAQRKLPETDWEVFLAKIGLGSWLSRFVTGIIFLLIIYLVFIPNFLFIKHITISDSDASGIPAAQNLVTSFLNKYTPLPQKNIVLLSKDQLKNFLLKNDQQILSVDKITKKFPSTLVVNVSPRLDEFEFLTASSTLFSVSNDGLVTGQLFPDASGTLPSLPFLIKLDGGGNLALGQNVLSSDRINFIRGLGQQLPAITKSTLGHYEMEDLISPYLYVNIQAGYQIKFDVTSDLSKTLDQLNLLISQILPGDYKNLYYIDMRFVGRSYVCFKNTACANQTVISNAPATTTPDLIGN